MGQAKTYSQPPPDSLNASRNDSLSDKHLSHSENNRFIFLSVAVVSLIVCMAAGFTFFHLLATDRLTGPFQMGISVLIVFFGMFTLLVVVSHGRLLKHVVAATFCAGSLYLFTIINAGLFLQNDISIAAQHAAWFIPIQVCVFTTIARRTAVILSSLQLGVLTISLAAYFVSWNINPLVAVETASLVQLVIAQAASLVLLGGLAVFREAAIARGAKVEVLEETAEVLAASAKEAERDRQRALDALSKAEAATRSREAFLATMSHELRTPLNAIIGFAQVLEMGIGTQPPTEKQRDYMVDIRQSGEHMLSLITRLLEFSRLNADGFDITFADHSITATGNQALRMVSVLAEEKSIKLEQVWQVPELFEIETDDRAVLQILVNLLSNAIKFTPVGGTVQLQMSFIRDEMIEMTVRDTGTGIPAEMLETICQPFVQVGDPLRAEVSGTGLGLSIVTKLVASLRGQFKIESDLGKGTRCRVQLPIRQPLSLDASTQKSA